MHALLRSLATASLLSVVSSEQPLSLTKPSPNLISPQYLHQSLSIRSQDCRSFDLSQNARNQGRYHCAYFEAPLDYAAADTAPQVNIPFVVVTQNAEHLSDKAVFLAGGGGPGNSLGIGQDHLSFEFLLAGMQVFLDAGYDVVMADQRGTGISLPNVGCPGLSEKYRELLAQPIGVRALHRQTEAILLACQQRLAEQGIDVSQYDTQASAQDFLGLMEQLPYHHWSLMGVSYGAQLALTMAQQAPADIDSLVLDSLPAYHDEAHVLTLADLQRRVTHILDLCREDARCHQRYPGLSFHFKQLIEQVERSPAVLPMENGAEFMVDAERLHHILFAAAYWPDYIAYIPYTIHAATYENDWVPLTSMAQNYYDWMVDSGYGDMLQVNIFCESSWPLQRARLLRQPQILQQWTADDLASWQASESLCRHWGGQPFAHDPQEVMIPTVILSGGLDPITPAASAQAMQRWLPNSVFIEDPLAAHSMSQDSRCAQHQLSEFLRAPQAQGRQQVRCDAPSFTFH